MLTATYYGGTSQRLFMSEKCVVPSAPASQSSVCIHTDLNLTTVSEGETKKVITFYLITSPCYNIFENLKFFFKRLRLFLL